MTTYLQHPPDLHDPAVAAVYDELSFWSARFGALLFAHLPIPRAGRILDLGCGTGFPFFEVAHTCGPACQVVGIDNWREAIDRARFKWSVYRPANARLIRGDGARLPFAGAAFDLLVSNLGINNFADPATVLAEAWRVLKPGGRIAVTTNLQGHMQEFYAVFREILQEQGHLACLPRLATQEAHRGTADSHAALFRNAGFAITRAVPDQFYLRYRDGTALFNHPLTRLGFLDGWRSVLTPEIEPAVFAALEQRLNALADQTGELRLTIPMLYLEGQKPA